MHLACAVFRAVECRKPLLVAANAGITASIDSDGRMVEQLPRRQTGVVIAQVRLDSRQSFYLLWGDWLWGSCLLACLLLAAVGIKNRRKSKKI
jgi:apolipoprotein N-acyltransferase